MKFTRSNLITALFVITLAGGGVYYFFFFNNDSGSALSSSDAAVSEQEQTFLSLHDEISAISFDTSLLNDPRFMSRTDIRTTIIPEPTGRMDPFAPIAGSSAIGS